MFKLNGNQNKLYTKKEILELQENETITLEIDKRVARLIGFALDTEMKENENLIEFLNKQDTTNYTQEQKNMINESIKNGYETYSLCDDIKEMLKQYYGWLQD